MTFLSNKGDGLRTKIFTDGQPHIELDQEVVDGKHVDISFAIRNPEDLMNLMMISEILDNAKVTSHLTIKYLMADRMERRMSDTQPATLKVVCKAINTYFPNSTVAIFCPHSDAASFLLNNYVDSKQSEKNFYHWVNKKVGREDFDMILPDQGAGKRWFNYFMKTAFVKNRKVECSKKRDMDTGALSHFVVPYEVKEHCVIVDDLCDGGRTFMGLAEKLRKKGAKRVDLAVCHGIFSYGYDLKGIDHIYTTDSYRTQEQHDNVTTYGV